MTLPLLGPMSLTGFAHPWFFLVLLFVAALVALYVITQYSRQKRVLRFANMELLESVAPQRPAKWRHLSAILLICSLVLLTIAMAGPQNDVRIPRNRAVVMLVIDVSQSMRATDVPRDADFFGPGNSVRETELSSGWHLPARRRSRTANAHHLRSGTYD